MKNIVHIGLPKAPGLARVLGECSGESDTALRNFSDSLALKNGRRSGSYFLETARGVRPGDLMERRGKKMVQFITKYYCNKFSVKL